MLEYGLNLLFSFRTGSFSLCGEPVWLPSRLRRGPAFSYASNGFLNTLFDFAGLGEGLGAAFNGDACRLLGAGWKLSSRTLTKLLGKSPMALGSLRSLPIHHRPSPALSASIRSPSMKPRSFLVSPPQEYVAWHQHGKREGASRGPPMLSVCSECELNGVVQCGRIADVGLEACVVKLW